MHSLVSCAQASVSTALPSIIHDLDGTDSFVWVSSAYTLACTAILPLSGRLADIFGRQLVLLVEARGVLVEGRVRGEQSGTAFYGLAEERALVCMCARFGLGLGEEDREGIEDEFV